MIGAFIPASGSEDATPRISSFTNFFKSNNRENDHWNDLAYWLFFSRTPNPHASSRPAMSICQRSPILFHLLDFRSSGGIFAHFCYLHFVFRFPFCLPSILNLAFGSWSASSAKSLRNKRSPTSSYSFSFFSSSPRTRYSVFLPSDATSIGAFAGEHLPAGAGYATPSQKRRIREIGATSGCHTCGRRRIPSTVATVKDTTGSLSDEAVDFYADHQPPLSKNQAGKVSLR